MQRVTRYQWLLVIMHWLMALLVPIALAGGALVLVKIPNTDPSKIEALRQHMAGGTLLLALMLIRWVVRVRTAHPARASTGNSVLDSVAWLSHRLIYVLVLGQAGCGIYLALQADLPDIVLGGHGALPADFWVFPMRSVHYVISRLLMAVIALHVAGALYHTFFLRDGLLRRMWFGRSLLRSPDSVVPARGQPLS
jgi:cytochrome b561